MESKATKEAIGEEQRDVQPTGVNGSNTSQEQQGLPGEDTLQKVNSGDLATNRGVNEGGDWTLVVYRKQNKRQQYRQLTSGRTLNSNKWGMGKAKNQTTGGFTSLEVQKAFKNALKEGRCLRCLCKGHKRVHCRDPIRCFKCKSLGHQIGSCRQLIRGGEGHIRKLQRGPARPVTNQYSFSQVLKKGSQNTTAEKPKTAVRMEFEEEEPFLNERPEESHVFSAPRGALRPENEHLDRTGVIIMLQGAPTPDLPRDIARTFARYHGWQPRDYEVFPAADSPFLVICQGILLRDQVVLRGVYRIRPGVVIRVLEWGVDLHMAYNPPPCEAWVRLIHLPVQAWNSPEIRKTSTQLGLITGIMPYGRAAGHFNHITLRVACEDPAEMPKHLVYHEGDLTARVRVRLLRWRFHENSPFPLYPDRGRAQVNQRNPPLSRQESPPRRHQGASSTIIDVNINNYSCGSTSRQPARNRVGHANGKEEKHKENDMGQRDATRRTTLDDMQRGTELVMQDQDVAASLGDRVISQIVESLQDLIISPMAQKEGQESLQGSDQGMREEVGAKKDNLERIFEGKKDVADGEKEVHAGDFNEMSEQGDGAFKEGLFAAQKGGMESHSTGATGGVHSRVPLNKEGNFNLGQSEAPKAEAQVKNNSHQPGPKGFRMPKEKGPAQFEFYSLDAQAQQGNKNGLSEVHKGLETTPTRVPVLLRRGKENSLPLRRSARREAKESAEQGFYRSMEKGTAKPRANVKDRLKIDFEVRKEEIGHQLAMAIVNGSGLKITDEIEEQFGAAATKDLQPMVENIAND